MKILIQQNHHFLILCLSLNLALQKVYKNIFLLFSQIHILFLSFFFRFLILLIVFYHFCQKFYTLN